MASPSRCRSTLGVAAYALLAAVALLCVGAPQGVGALHEDQVGSYDWHQQYLGEVTQAAAAGNKANRRAFVSTEQGAIAALNFNTGEIGECVLRVCRFPRSRIQPSFTI